MTKRVAAPTDQSLRVPLAQLKTFNKTFGRCLATTLDFEHQRYLSLEKLSDLPGSPALDYGLVEGGKSLTAIDDRGTQQPVVHFLSSVQQHLLLALNFSWWQASNAARFQQVQVLVFIAWGDANVARTTEGNRRQLLRLEWEGVNQAGVFDSKTAAQPHWHTDQWLAGYDRERSQAAARLSLREGLHEFEAHAESNAPPNVRWMRSVHLAAAARWADIPWTSQNDCSMHAKAPENLQNVENWTLSAIRYVSHEFRAAIDRAG